MEGDNTKAKGIKTNKAIELLYRLSLRVDFQKDIEKARIILNIPSHGFSSYRERQESINNIDSILFTDQILNILKKYKISLAYYVPLQEYLEMGKIKTKTKQEEFVAVIDDFAHRNDIDSGNLEEFYREFGEPFAKVLILGNSTKSDVIDFINRNWNKIQSILAEQGNNPNQRIRKKKDKNKDRDKNIIELSKETTENLKKQLGNPIGTLYKEDLIKKIMERDGYHISDGYIRKIIQQYR